MSRRPGTAVGREAGREGAELACGMCGTRFREDRGQPACAACPLARACRYVRCPRCGFENPVTPGWMEPGVWARGMAALRAAWGRTGRRLTGRGSPRARPAAARAAAAADLTDVPAGGVATVVGLADTSGSHARALAGLGLLPGAEIEVVQRFPAWILRVDHAEIAVDGDLARQVRVRRR